MTKHAGAAGPLLAIAALGGGALWIGFSDTPADSLAERIMADEGYRQHIYLDTSGNRTFGYGFNLEVGITKPDAEYLLRSHLGREYRQLIADEPWIRNQPRETEEALLEIAYQLGVRGEEGFHVMLDALQHGQCVEAKRAALDSAWARETPARAKRVTESLCD